MGFALSVKKYGDFINSFYENFLSKLGGKISKFNNREYFIKKCNDQNFMRSQTIDNCHTFKQKINNNVHHIKNKQTIKVFNNIDKFTTVKHQKMDMKAI